MSEGKKIDTKGEILLKSGNVIQWKGPDFFSLPEDIFYCFESPSFPSMDGIWCLGYVPSSVHPEHVFVYLKRIHSISNPTFTIRICIQINNWDEICQTCIRANFHSDGIYQGVHIPVANRHLQGDEVPPKRDITLFCVLPLEDNKIVASHPIQTKDVSTNTDEEDSLNKLKDGEYTSTKAEGTEKLSQSFKNIFVTGDHHDTIINVKDQQFRTHKLVLNVRSTVLESLFEHDRMDRNTNIITIKDCDAEAFKEFLSFLYSGKVENVSVENVSDLYYIADKYQEHEVKSQCVKFIMRSMSVENFCDFISLALRHSEEELLKSATNYFARNAKKISRTVRWLSFLKEHPVESNELNLRALTLLDPD